MPSDSATLELGEWCLEENKRRGDLPRNGSTGRAERRMHTHAGGNLRLATAVLTNNGSTHATMGIEDDQVPVTLSSRRGFRNLETWRLKTILGRVPASST